MEKNGFISSIIKSASLSVIIALSGILALSAIMCFTYLPNVAIKSVTQFIKVLSLFIGCFFMLKGNKGLIKGIISGATFWVITFILFGLINGFSLPIIRQLADALFMIAIGGISGVFAVNLKKEK